MQHRRAVAVEHALGFAGGARGVAERAGSLLVELRPVEVVALGRDQIVVERDRRKRGLGAAEQNDPHVLGQLRPQPLDQRDEAGFEEKQPVGGVIEDVDDLFVGQHRVDRVADPADPGNPVVELEVAVGVPGHCRDAVAGFDAEPQQRLGDAPRAPLRFGIGIAMDRAFERAADDFGVGVIARRVLDAHRYQQRLVAHQPAQHACPPASQALSGVDALRRAISSATVRESGNRTAVT
jgi:hypothetical protein